MNYYVTCLSFRVKNGMTIVITIFHTPELVIWEEKLETEEF